MGEVGFNPTRVRLKPESGDILRVVRRDASTPQGYV